MMGVECSAGADDDGAAGVVPPRRSSQESHQPQELLSATLGVDMSHLTAEAATDSAQSVASPDLG